MLQEEGQGDAARGSSRDAAGDDANDVSPDFLSDGVLQVHDAKYVFATKWVFFFNEAFGVHRFGSRAHWSPLF
jgi:hypothetical protein